MSPQCQRVHSASVVTQRLPVIEFDAASCHLGVPVYVPRSYGGHAQPLPPNNLRPRMPPHPQEQQHPTSAAPVSTTPPVNRVQAISPHAHTYAAEHGDAAGWPPERFKIYAELGGIQ